jgi:hypothetical protein
MPRLGDGRQKTRMPAREGSEYYEICHALELSGYVDLARSLAAAERAHDGLHEAVNPKHWINTLSKAKGHFVGTYGAEVLVRANDPDALRCHAAWKKQIAKKVEEINELVSRAREVL